MDGNGLVPPGCCLYRAVSYHARGPRIRVGLVEFVRDPVRRLDGEQQNVARRQRASPLRLARTGGGQPLIGRQRRRELYCCRRYREHVWWAIAKGNPQPLRQQDGKNEDPEDGLRLAYEQPKAHHCQLIETAQLELTHRANSFP